MSYHGGRSKSCAALAIFVGLASRRFGLTLTEMMQEAKIKRRQALETIRTLERLGVVITRHREPVRHSWVTLYRLGGVRGLRLDIRRQAQ